jgi:hypothetical protein
VTKDKQQAQVFLEAAARLEAAKENNFCPMCGQRLVIDELHACAPAQLEEA